MTTTNGRRIGWWSLRLDAIYCAVLGAGVLVCAPLLSTVISLPAPAIGALGLVVIVWSMTLWWLVVRARLRVALRLVMTVNIVAALSVAAVSAAAATTFAALAVIAVAADVGLFATSQAVALRSLRRARAA